MTELQILVLKSDITTLRQLLQNMLALPIHEMDRRARVKEFYMSLNKRNFFSKRVRLSWRSNHDCMD